MRTYYEAPCALDETLGTIAGGVTTSVIYAAGGA
jgi:hypothetical protein